VSRRQSAIFGKSKIIYRKCKTCGEMSIVNPDKTLRRHGSHTTWSPSIGGYITVYCNGK
jgi:hypothetical protein